MVTGCCGAGPGFREKIGVRQHKSLLQQVARRAIGETPQYELVDEKGPVHS
jgi:hypothetical protein